MKVFAAFLLMCLAAEVAHAVEECQNVVSCLCGGSGENITVCADGNTEVCTRLSKCKMCEEGSDVCSECPEGFKGPLCSEVSSKYCENPEPIANGKSQFSHPTENITQEMDHFPVETVRTYSCNEDYRLSGSKFSECVTCPSCKTARWHPDDTICRKDCGRDFFNSGPCLLMNCDKHVPWVVSISVENDNEVKDVCLGVLLNGQTVLTAAHCLVGHSTFIIRFGKHRLNNQKYDTELMTRRVSRIIIHPDFSNTTFDSNIGLAFFNPRIRFTADVKPICLYRNWNYPNNQAGRTGFVSVTYGTKNAFSTGSMSLSRVQVLSDESCLKVTKRSDFFITRNSFCAGNNDEYQNMCEGNSGAPLFSYDKWTGTFLLQGILSFSARICMAEGNYAVFTQYDNFEKWIDGYLK